MAEVYHHRALYPSGGPVYNRDRTVTPAPPPPSPLPPSLVVHIPFSANSDALDGDNAFLAAPTRISLGSSGTYWNTVGVNVNARTPDNTKIGGFRPALDLRGVLLDQGASDMVYDTSPRVPPWTAHGCSVSTLSSYIAGALGRRLTEDGSNGEHYVNFPVVFLVANTRYTISVIAKVPGSNPRSQLRVLLEDPLNTYFDGEPEITFNLADATWFNPGGNNTVFVNPSPTGDSLNDSIFDLGGGYFLMFFGVDVPASGAATNLRLQLVKQSAGPVYSTSYAGDGVSGIEIYHASVARQDNQDDVWPSAPRQVNAAVATAQDTQPDILSYDVGTQYGIGDFTHLHLFTPLLRLFDAEVTILDARSDDLQSGFRFYFKVATGEICCDVLIGLGVATTLNSGVVSQPGSGPTHVDMVAHYGLALVRQSGDVHFYVRDMNAETTVAQSATVDGVTPIGDVVFNPSGDCPQIVKEVQVYNAALSQATIDLLFSPSDLIAVSSVRAASAHKALWTFDRAVTVAGTGASLKLGGVGATSLVQTSPFSVTATYAGFLNNSIAWSITADPSGDLDGGPFQIVFPQSGSVDTSHGIVLVDHVDAADGDPNYATWYVEAGVAFVPDATLPDVLGMQVQDPDDGSFMEPIAIVSQTGNAVLQYPKAVTPFQRYRTVSNVGSPDFSPADLSLLFPQSGDMGEA